MATREEMFTALRAADAAGATDDAQHIAQMISALPSDSPKEPTRYESMPTADKLIEGAKGALRRVARPMVPTVDGGALGGVDPSRMDAEGAYYRQHKDELGTAGVVGDVGADVLASIAPVGAANRAASVLTKTLGGLKGQSARVGADIAANAGYAAATTDGDRTNAALAGGAGAAGGRLLTRTLGGVARPFVSKDAQTLIDAGVTPTPGQLFGDGLGGRMARATEDRLMSIPLAGDIIRNARTRSMEQYGNAEINAALKPLGSKVSGAGEDAVASAQRTISEAYDMALPQTFLAPSEAARAVLGARKAAQNIPLLTVEQEGKLIQYIARKIQPAIDDAASSGKPIDGHTAKAIDAEIGHYAREFSTAADPSQHSLGEAFYELQSSMRGALDATNPAAKSLLKQANSAYRQLLPSVKAADRAMGQQGRFTPLQFNRAAQQFGQEGNELNTAARNVLPASIPDSGTAGRALLGATALGGAATAGALGHTVAATGLAAALYSRPGMSMLVNGLRGVVPDKVLAHIASLPPAGQRTALDQLAATVPAVGRRLVEIGPQVARALATQEQQQ